MNRERCKRAQGSRLGRGRSLSACSSSMWVRAKKIKDEAEHPFTREPVAKDVAELPAVPRDHMLGEVEEGSRVGHDQVLVDNRSAPSGAEVWPKETGDEAVNDLRIREHRVEAAPGRGKCDVSAERADLRGVSNTLPEKGSDVPSKGPGRTGRAPEAKGAATSPEGRGQSLKGIFVPALVHPSDRQPVG